MKDAIVEMAHELSETVERVEYLEKMFARYRKDWNITLICDSTYFDARNMVFSLPETDKKAISKYIVKRVRQSIREGKLRADELTQKLSEYTNDNQ